MEGVEFEGVLALNPELTKVAFDTCRLARSRKTVPYAAVKGYGEHSGWMGEVEQRRALSARSSQAPEMIKTSSRYSLKQVSETSRDKYDR